MRSRTRSTPGAYGRLLDTEQLCAYLNIGKNSAMKFADECGAKRKIGRSARYDRDVIDEALNKMPIIDTCGRGDNNEPCFHDETKAGE